MIDFTLCPHCQILPLPSDNQNHNQAITSYCSTTCPIKFSRWGTKTKINGIHVETEQFYANIYFPIITDNSFTLIIGGFSFPTDIGIDFLTLPFSPTDFSSLQSLNNKIKLLLTFQS